MSDYNAADTKQIRKAERRARLAATERALVVLNLMSSPAGRAYVHDWLVRTHVFHTPFTGDRSTTDFACGEQNVGLQLFREVVASAPDQYIQMMREANDRERASDRDDRQRERQSNGDRRDNDSAGDGSSEVRSDYDPGAGEESAQSD